MTLWRISNHGDLAGLGGEKADGRWHRAARGKRIVYLSEHPALALIETLANLKGNPQLFADAYQLMKINVAGIVKSEALPLDTLPDNWREESRETRSAGDDWLARGNSALLAVPSVPSPESLNYLFNPLHADAKNVVMQWRKRIKYDRRLFRTSESLKGKIQTKIK